MRGRLSTGIKMFLDGMYLFVSSDISFVCTMVPMLSAL